MGRLSFPDVFLATTGASAAGLLLTSSPNLAGILAPFAFMFLTEVLGRVLLSWQYINDLEYVGLVGINFVVWQGSVHGLALYGVLVYTPHPLTLGLAAFWLLACELSINAGYHRMWSHGSFQAHAAVRAVFAAFGAAASQNSILWWSHYHRAHHRWLDDPVRDPYSAANGLWHTHCGWLFSNTDRFVFPAGHLVNTGQKPWMMQIGLRDLKRDPVVVWQHRFFIPLMYLMALALPAWIAALWGDSLGGFLYAGMARLVINYHSIWLVNSASHHVGSRPWSRANTSTDSHLLAVLTFGEGYHNRHHEFPEDYRHGARWYDFDPPKWLVAGLVAAGLAWRPRAVGGDAPGRVAMQAAAGEAGVRLSPAGQVLAGKPRGSGGPGADGPPAMGGVKEARDLLWPPAGLESRARKLYSHLAEEGAARREERALDALAEVVDDFRDGQGSGSDGEDGAKVGGAREAARARAASLGGWGPRPRDLPWVRPADLPKLGLEHYVVLDDLVLDVSELIRTHPGGADALLGRLGKDVSQAFHGLAHVHTQHARNQAAALAKYVVVEE